MVTEKSSDNLVELRKSGTLRKNEWHWLAKLPHMVNSQVSVPGQFFMSFRGRNADPNRQD